MAMHICHLHHWKKQSQGLRASVSENNGVRICRNESGWNERRQKAASSMYDILHHRNIIDEGMRASLAVGFLGTVGRQVQAGNSSDWLDAYLT